MEPSRRVSSYDLFKFVVAIILLILFFLLRSRVTPQSPTPISTFTIVPTLFGNAASTTVPEPSASISLTSTSVPIHTSTATNVAATTQTPLPSPTATKIAITTTPLPSPTATQVIEPTATALPSPTTTAVIESTSPSLTGTPVVSACDSASSRSRLQSGMNAIILRRLNFRSSPGIQNNWLLTNIPGTKVQVVGGPECVPHLTGAYVWWQIKLPNGQIGWSAEGSQFGSFYFMEPAP